MGYPYRVSVVAKDELEAKGGGGGREGGREGVERGSG